MEAQKQQIPTPSNAPNVYDGLSDSDYEGDSEHDLNHDDYGLASVVLIDPVASKSQTFDNTPAESVASFDSSEDEEDLVMIRTPSSGEEMANSEMDFEFPVMRFSDMELDSKLEDEQPEVSRDMDTDVGRETSTTRKSLAESVTPARAETPTPTNSQNSAAVERSKDDSKLRETTEAISETSTTSPVEPTPAAPEVAKEAQPESLSEKEKEALKPHIYALSDLLSAKNNATFTSVLQTLKDYIKEHPYLSALQVASILLTLFPATAFPALFWALGFGRAGPVAGTLATTWQASFVGGATAGSYFSACQSVAMGGVKGLAMLQNAVRCGAVSTYVGSALGTFAGWKKGSDGADGTAGKVEKAATVVDEKFGDQDEKMQ